MSAFGVLFVSYAEGESSAMRTMYCSYCNDRVPSSECTMVLSEEFNMLCRERCSQHVDMNGYDNSQVPLCYECNQEYQTMLQETVNG